MCIMVCRSTEYFISENFESTHTHLDYSMEHVNKTPTFNQWRDQRSSQKPCSKPAFNKGAYKKVQTLVPPPISQKQERARKMVALLCAMDHFTISEGVSLKNNKDHWQVLNCSQTQQTTQVQRCNSFMDRLSHAHKKHWKKPFRKDSVNRYKHQPVQQLWTKRRRVQINQRAVQPDQMIKVHIQDQHRTVRIQPSNENGVRIQPFEGHSERFQPASMRIKLSERHVSHGPMRNNKWRSRFQQRPFEKSHTVKSGVVQEYYNQDYTRRNRNERRSRWNQEYYNQDYTRRNRNERRSRWNKEFYNQGYTRRNRNERRSRWNKEYYNQDYTRREEVL